MVWTNCNKYEEDELEKIPIEAARIVIGSTKLVSISYLYEETGWETLSARQKQHRLTLFYKRLLPISNPTLDLLLFGDTTLSYQVNVNIFSAVQDYIMRTKRFV